VVVASEGYPGTVLKGRVIEGLDAAAKLPFVKVFHAGTTMSDGKVVTSGGRVLGVTAWGPDLATARARAYDACSRIRFEGMQLRSDIGAKGLASGL
jgi:phosphoribosylamine--glycine ligase